MKVLVTGGAGFVGSHVVRALLEAGVGVRVVDSFSPDVHPAGRTDAIEHAELVVPDLRDADAVDRALSGVDAVVHQSAMVGLGVDIQDLPAYVDANDLGTAVLLAAMARVGVGRLVLASSMVVYGEGAYPCAEHGRVQPGPRSSADLAAGRFEPLCPRCGAAFTPPQWTRTRHWTPVTCTRRRRWPRNISRPPLISASSAVSNTVFVRPVNNPPGPRSSTPSARARWTSSWANC